MANEMSKEELLEAVRSASSEEAKRAAKDALTEHKAEEQAEAERLEKEKEEREAMRAELEEEVREELEEKIKSETPAWQGGFNTKKESDLGDDKENRVRATGKLLWEWIKTGNRRYARGLRALGLEQESMGDLSDQIVDFDDPDVRAALQEDTGSEGGFLVPNDFFPGIVQKRDQVSFARRAGVQVMQTNRDIIDIPTENAKQGNFVITSEESAYDTDAGPSFSNTQVTIYKFTRTHRVSEELEADEAVGLPQFLSDALGRAWGLTENQYISTGTGSAQPQGIVVGADTDDIYDIGTDAEMSSSDVASVYTSLTEPYRVNDEAAWLVHGNIEAQHIGRVSANKPELGEALLGMTRDPADGGVLRLAGFRMFTDSNIATPALGTTTFSGVFGNMRFYALVERSGLVVTRNPWLYMANGQVGIFAKARWGGAVLQDEAFKPIRSLL